MLHSCMLKTLMDMFSSSEIQLDETLFIELPNLNHFRGLQIFFSQSV